MKSVLALLVLIGCGGPSQQQLAETPSAQSRAAPAVAPPASTSDKDRERLNQQFEDMETTQRAYREAGQGSAAPQPVTKPADEAAPKKAPVEQAPVDPAKKKRKAPVEQAPKQ